jgi:hypothetical protein
MWKKLKEKFSRKKKEEAPQVENVNLKIWGIVNGPFHKEELPHNNVPEDLNFMIVCKVEEAGEVYDQEMWFPDLTGIVAWQKHFATTVEPISIDLRY